MNSQLWKISAGEHVVGTYYNVPFAGKVESTRQNTANYRKTVIFIDLDAPITVFGKERDGLCIDAESADIEVTQ